MKINLNVKKRPNHAGVCKCNFKQTKEQKKRCYCSINLDLFKSRKFNHEEIFQIQGLSDVSLMGNDSPSEIHTSKILLSGLGPKFEQLLDQTTVKLDYPTEVVQAIHDFTLSGVCNFDSVNLRSLLSAAKEFNIIGIKAQAGQYLIAATHNRNVQELYKLSQELLCTHTTRRIKEFILEHFEELGQNEHFLKLCNPIWMKAFIKDETLNASEENVFKILVNWAKESLENEQSIPQLTRFIRFGLMDQNFFNAVVKTCPFLQNNSQVQSAERSIQSRARNGFHHLPGKVSPRIPHELVFAVGGFTTKACSTVEVFDARAQRWCSIPDSVFPAHAYHGTATLDGKLFVLGGFGEDREGPEHFQAAYCMDLSSQTWARKSIMQNRRCYVSVAELKGKLYCIGGYNGRLRFNTVECFDPNTNQWTMIKPMNKVRSDACAVAYDNKIVVVGGFDGEEIHQTTEIYDPESDEWTFGPRMSQPRSGLKAVVLENKIYVIGGFNGAERLKSVETLDQLNPNATWMPISELITQRSNFGATVVNKQIMVAGGFDGHQVISDTELYSEETNQWTPSQPMDLKRSALTLVTVKGLPNRKNYLDHHF